MSPLREQLRQRASLVGCFQQIPAAESTEAAAFAGLDFSIFDLEHALIDDAQIAALLRAAEASGIAPLARLPHADGPRIGRLLDAGLAGIFVAHVRSAAAAREIVEATRYPPRGHRSAAGTRATGYGRTASLPELIDSEGGDPAVVAMIEDGTGVENASEIAAVDGVDALFLGTTDLSVDLGAPGQRDHPDVVAAVSAVCEAAAAHGISAGVPVASGADGRIALERGATFVATGDVHTLIGGLEQFRATSLE